MSDLISRCDLFNKLATIPAPPEANELKAQIYAVINEMDSIDAVIIGEPIEDDSIEIEMTYEDGYRWYRLNRKNHRDVDDFCSYGARMNSSEIPNNCEPQKWTRENCKGCKYNEYPYDGGTCFVRVCINGNKYEPKDEQAERSK